MSQFRFEAWPTQHRVITQHFGVNPRNYAQFGLPGHEGVDIRAPNGSKVFCVAPGRVSGVRTTATGHNYGIHVRVDHQDGYQTTYAHLQKALVGEGEQVEAGTILGLADNTGNSFGAHLHLTLKLRGSNYRNWPRDIIDPTPFLLPLMGWTQPAGPYVGGWVLTAGIIISGRLAQANPDGVTLRSGPDQAVVVPGGTIMVLAASANQSYTPVQVPKAAIGYDTADWPTMPAPEPPPTVTTIDGWAWEKYLHNFGNQALIATRYGVNLRTKSSRSSSNIGVVRAGSTVSLIGDAEKEYVPVRVRRSDFIGPVRLPVRPPELPQEALTDLPEDVHLGWLQSPYLRRQDGYAIVGHRGLALRSQPALGSDIVGMVKGDATVTIAGQSQAGFTPVLVNEQMMFDLARPGPEPQIPKPFPDESMPVMPPPVPVHNTVPGWVLTIDLVANGDEGTAGPHGLLLHEAPRRDAETTGFVESGTQVVVMGLPFGEFSPIRAPEKKVKPPLPEPDPAPYGQARIGLHASADPTISEAEHRTFTQLRPGLIKVLSFHSAEDIGRLATANPQAGWIVRAFLSMEGRNVRPSQFVGDTLPDVRRALEQLDGKDVVVELHNEPNLASEGLGTSWADGAEFARWWLDVLRRYRGLLPGVKFIYPGVSPGSSVTGVKVDHIQFLEASRESVDAADGLGMHLYWSHLFPMNRSLDILDDLISRFRNKQIWITEASNNTNQTEPAEKARQYLQFWHELQKRPVVQGVTYYVASASEPAYASEVWVGRGIAQIVGAR